MTVAQPAAIAVLTISDRASQGIYEDKSGPAVEAWLQATLLPPFRVERRIVPDGLESVRDALIGLSDDDEFDLVLTTGGTGPSPRDLTPEAMIQTVDKVLAGFGELMRRVSFSQVPTAILSRQEAGIRGKTLIINIPGKPDAIKMCLDAVFPAVPYCLDLMGAGFIDTDPTVLRAFRPQAR